MSALNSSSLDLQSIALGQRAVVWKQAAGALFPGLKVEALPSDPSCGSIEGSPFGSGQIWSILSPPLCVHYEPVASTCRTQAVFSVMLQVQGATGVSQHNRRSMLRRNDLCLIDGLEPFNLEVTDPGSQIMFLRIPRELVLCRYPYLEDRTARTFDPDEPGTGLLRQMLLGLLESAPLLSDEQRAVALVCAAHLLGIPKPPSDAQADSVHWRARSALDFIDANLSDPLLDASRVAEDQGVSRRWLDEILLQAIGSSLTAQIWIRRLSQAACDLRDATQAKRTVTSIAFSLGFADAAHFARSFKRRYGCTLRVQPQRVAVSRAGFGAD
jgi:AraC family transcriptional regulator, positive regulator of tynA and feaB